MGGAAGRRLHYQRATGNSARGTVALPARADVRKLQAYAIEELVKHCNRKESSCVTVMVCGN